jgi:hypothetical protein
MSSVVPATDAGVTSVEVPPALSAADNASLSTSSDNSDSEDGTAQSSSMETEPPLVSATSTVDTRTFRLI